MAKSIIMLFAIKVLPEVNGKGLRRGPCGAGVSEAQQLEASPNCTLLASLLSRSPQVSHWWGIFGIYFGYFPSDSFGRTARLRGSGWWFY
jgi:hypothetical protein